MSKNKQKKKSNKSNKQASKSEELKGVTTAKSLLKFNHIFKCNIPLISLIISEVKDKHKGKRNG